MGLPRVHSRLRERERDGVVQIQNTEGRKYEEVSPLPSYTKRIWEMTNKDAMYARVGIHAKQSSTSRDAVYTT